MQLPCIAISQSFVLFSILCLHHPRRHANCRAISGNGSYDHSTCTNNDIFINGQLIDNLHPYAARYSILKYYFTRNAARWHEINVSPYLHQTIILSKHPPTLRDKHRGNNRIPFEPLNDSLREIHSSLITEWETATETEIRLMG
jgi:hypothetical protein